MNKVYLNWSSGKDAALALYSLLQNKNYTVDLLVTTVNSDFNRVSMHGLRASLLDNQIEQIGIPHKKILMSGNVSMETYNTTMSNFTNALKEENFTHSVFGDIFLEDLRIYREQQLKKVGIKALFPLWQNDTKQIIKDFVALGFKAITVCINAKLLDKSYVGCIVDQDFIDRLPEGVDPCGENGEFHTFVFDGPIFKNPIEFTIGEKVLKSYAPSDNDNDCFSEDAKSWDTQFWFCDLIPQ